MRDGIFKTAPLSPKWHVVGRRAEREADHGERLKDALSDALKDDLKKELAMGLKGIVGIVADGQFSIFGAEELKEILLGLKPDSRFSQDVIGNIQFVCKGGEPFDPQALIDAFSRAAKRHVEVMRADMLGHANKHTDRVQLKKVTDGFNEAVAQLDYSATAREVLFGVKKQGGEKDHTFNMSDDLSR